MHFETPHGDPYGETTHGETAQMYEETIHGEIRVETPHGDPYGETTHGETAPMYGETIHGEIRGATDGETIHGENSRTTDGETTTPAPQFHPPDLVGRTFLMNEQEDGQRFRARIVEAIEQHENTHAKESALHKFRVSVNDDQYKEILSYNDILNFIEQKENNEETIWKFKRIVGHQGPLNSSDRGYSGSKWNVMIEWETGEVTAEPLTTIAADDPVTCAIYAKEKGLLNEPGWKRFKGIAKRDKKMLRQVNQAKLRSFRSAPKYQYGYEVPRDYDHAMKLDQRNGNTHWQDSIQLEMVQLDEYDTFIDHGDKNVASAPDGYKKIRVHLVFMIKHDGRHKSRLVADGHLTDVPVESVYSGVVSLRGLRLMIFLAELNGLDAWATDIGNAYVEAKTEEKCYIIAGREFGDQEGHILVVHKALYGLQSSGLRWSERLAECLREMGFVPCKAEPDIWMHRNGDIYDAKAYMFGDNESVVNSSSTPHAKLHKRHNALSFHRVREAVAMKIIGYYHIRSETNPSDVLSKHWGHSQVWPLLQCVLFWRGDTADLLDIQED